MSIQLALFQFADTLKLRQQVKLNVNFNKFTYKLFERTKEKISKLSHFYLMSIIHLQGFDQEQNSDIIGYYNEIKIDFFSSIIFE